MSKEIKSFSTIFDEPEAFLDAQSSVSLRIASANKTAAKAFHQVNQVQDFSDNSRAFKTGFLEDGGLISAESLTKAGATPKVAILLCTYNGCQYLPEQLDSFAAQSHDNWEVWVSDDGSKDGIHQTFESYKHKWSAGRISIRSGPCKGFSTNFVSVMCSTDSDADYYALSDQDDIWEAHKLERAVKWLESVPPEIPALYCSRTRLIDAGGKYIGFSPLFTKPASFANALTQNIAGGNTMIFNRALRESLKEAGENLPVIAHDWWVYLLVTGVGGQVFYDTHPTVNYRQHNGNLIGMKASWPARFNRIRMMWKGCYRNWNDANIASLRLIQDRLTPGNQKIFERFVQARNMPLIPRLINFKRSGIYRQTFLSNLGLIVAAIFNKL